MKKKKMMLLQTALRRLANVIFKKIDNFILERFDDLPSVQSFKYVDGSDFLVGDLIVNNEISIAAMNTWTFIPPNSVMMIVKIDKEKLKCDVLCDGKMYTIIASSFTKQTIKMLDRKTSGCEQYIPEM